MGQDNIRMLPEMSIRGKNDTLLVASSTATAKQKAIANYVCDGTNDQIEIQAALDSLGAVGGTVKLTNGTYNLSTGAASTELTGTGNMTNNLLDVGASHGGFELGDMIYIKGGDFTGSTLEARNAAGLYAVQSVTGHGGSATEIQVYTASSSAYTGVTWVKPAWAIKMPPNTCLEGEGLLNTNLRLINNANCSAIWLSCNATLAVGGHRLANLSVLGNAANQSADWWKTHGVMTGLAYDTHIVDCEVRYFKGYGISIGTGWGFVMRGGWIEDCQVGMFLYGGNAKVSQVKIQQCGTQAAGGAAVMISRQGGAMFQNCEIQSDTPNCPRAILLRGNLGTTIVGGNISASNPADACIETVDMDGAACRALLVEGVKFYTVSNSFVLSLTSWLLGARITGMVDGDPTTAVKNWNDFSHGIDINVIGTYRGIGSTQKSSNIGVFNNTGGNLADGYAYCWDSTSAEPDAVRLPAAAGDVGLFAGVNNAYPIATGTNGYLINSGRAVVCVNAAAAIVINDLLSLDTGGSNWGLMKKAGTGETAFARALAAKASGTGVISADIIIPRIIP